MNLVLRKSLPSQVYWCRIVATSFEKQRQKVQQFKVILMLHGVRGQAWTLFAFTCKLQHKQNNSLFYFILSIFIYMYFEEGLAKCMDNFRDQKKVLDPPELELHGAA